MHGNEYEILNRLFDDLFPICRSITGLGLRKSLEIIGEHIPLKIESVPSGTDIFDWTIPKEWHIHEARLTGPEGNIYADFDDTNLHVLNYSKPVDKHLSLDELEPHLYSDPDNPKAIPYVTSYYERRWGFCVSHETLKNLPEGTYHAYIDSEFIDGSLDYGHAILKGESDREFLISSYICHPSLANNELSGPLVLTALYNRIKDWDEQYFTYRFVLCPETIGSLSYLYNHGEELMDKLVGGLVLTCLGGPADKLSYKTTRKEDALIDQTVRHLNKQGELNTEIREFTPIGSEERQYCSPGFNLPVGQMARTVYRQYEYYHTSKDDKEFMGIKTLIDSLEKIEKFLQIFEMSGYYENLNPYGEPMLSKRNLYPTLTLSTPKSKDRGDEENEININKTEFVEMVLYILNYSDGKHSMIDIAEKYDCSIKKLIPLIEVLMEKDLIERLEISE